MLHVDGDFLRNFGLGFLERFGDNEGNETGKFS